MCVFFLSLSLRCETNLCIWSFYIFHYLFTNVYYTVFLTGKFGLNLFSVRSAPANPSKSMKNIEKFNLAATHRCLHPPLQISALVEHRCMHVCTEQWKHHSSLEHPGHLDHWRQWVQCKIARREPLQHEEWHLWRVRVSNTYLFKIPEKWTWFQKR